MGSRSRKKINIRDLIAIAITLMMLTSCGSSSQSGESKTINDAEMLSIDAVVDSESTRVVAVGNGVAEILVALGYTKSIVGRDIASDIPELKQIPIVTNGHELSAEKVLRTNPDLLIIDQSTSPKTVIEQVKRSGVRVVQSPDSFSVGGISRKVEFVARAIGNVESGRLFASAIERELAIYATPPKRERAKVLFLYLRGSNGIFLVGGRGSGADELLFAAGAEDLGSTLYNNPFTPINSEAILSLNPDAYLVMSKGLESIGGITEFKNLPGINPNVPVISVEDSLLLSFGPRTPSLIEQLHGAIYGR